MISQMLRPLSCQIHREYEDGRFDSLSETEGIRSIIYAYEDMEVLNEEWEKGY